MNITDAIVTAARKSEQALCEQLSQWESLPYGVAFWSEAFPWAAEANQLRDVWLADVNGQSAFEQAEAYFEQRGLTCGRWTTASGQAVQPVADILVRHGWRKRTSTVWGLSSWALLESPANESIRVLPARAMPKALRATFDDGLPNSDQRAELAAERLNDSRLDLFVAMLDGKPVGRVGYLQVGDIARLSELFVLSESRGAGVGRAMATHFLQLARRLLPHVIVACSDIDDAPAAAFLGPMGFKPAGELEYFEK